MKSQNSISKQIITLFFLLATVLAIGALLPAPNPQNQTALVAASSASLVSDIQTLTQNILSLSASIPRNGPHAALAGLNSDLAALQSLVAQRKEKMLALIKLDARAFLQNSMTAAQRDSLPTEVHGDVESSFSATAYLNVLAVDDFKNPSNSTFAYYMAPNSGQSQMVEIFPTSPLKMKSGAKVQIKGVILGSNAAVDTSSQATFKLLAMPANWITTGPQKTLVLLVKFADSPPEPFTPAQAAQMIFHGQMEKFYEEQSYNQVSWTGDVYGWLTLAENTANIPQMLDIVRFDNSEITNYIADSGIDLARYQHVVFLVDWNLNTTGTSLVGRTYVNVGGTTYGVSETWLGIDQRDYAVQYYNKPFPWTSFDFTLTHELGHAMGLLHAHLHNCGTAVIGGVCSDVEYGDIYDIMGPGTYALHTNSINKETLGWIPPGRVLTITQSGRYTLSNLESSGGYAYAKIIPYGQTAPLYYLEKRIGSGFDANLSAPELSSNQNGLFIRMTYCNPPWPGLPCVSESSLLNMHPETNGIPGPGPTNVTLNNGMPYFRDAASGITVGPVVEYGDSYVIFDVKVENPAAVPLKPFAILNSADMLPPQNISPGPNRVLGAFRISAPDPVTIKSMRFNINVTGPASGAFTDISNVYLYAMPEATPYGEGTYAISVAGPATIETLPMDAENATIVFPDTNPSFQIGGPNQSYYVLLGDIGNKFINGQTLQLSANTWKDDWPVYDQASGALFNMNKSTSKLSAMTIAPDASAFR